MSMERVQDAIGEAQEDFIADAEFRVVKKPMKWVYWVAAAACLVLGVAIGALVATKVKADEFEEYIQQVNSSPGFVTMEELSAEKSDALIAMEFEYPVNENGQTYGVMCGWGDGTTLMPDLVEVPLQGYDEYTPGYLYAETYKEYCEMDPIESLNKWTILDADGNPVGWGIPAYASDGVTVIGMF